MSTLDFNNRFFELSPILNAFAYNLTQNSDDAKDLYQETAFRAMSNRDKFMPDTNFKAWSFTIMKNIFINNYRRSARQNTIFDSTPNDYLLDYNQFSTANAAEATLSLKEIKEAVYALPEIFKNPFELYFEGYKYHEIADILAEPLGTIKSRIHFARKLLKQQLSRF